VSAAAFVKTYDLPPYNEREILRYAGVKGAGKEVDGLLKECLQEADGRFVGKVCYQEFSLQESPFSSLPKARLKGCVGYVVFAATVGLGIDRLIAKYEAISPVKALLMQAIGTERVESLCEAFCAELAAKKACEGLSVRKRFSPGYGDFAIEAQEEIFRVLQPQKHIGLAIGKSLLMSPSKSVTAIVGIGKEGRKEDYGCEVCTKACAYRKEK